MKLKIFTFRFSPQVDGFDDGPMTEFIADKEVIDVTEHFFVHEKTPYFMVLISYREISDYERKNRIRGPDPRAELDPEEVKTYDALRTWRASRAKQEGIPPYMIANNKQVAGIVKLKPESKTALASIKGLGEAKIQQYGDEIMKILESRQSGDVGEKEKTDKETVP